MADDKKKPIAEGDNLGVESTTISPETKKADDSPQRDEQSEAEEGDLSEAGGR